MARGWQQVRAPTSDREWIGVRRTEDGWTVEVMTSSPAGGEALMAVYGPVPSKGRAEGLRMRLLSALSETPSGNVALVLATFGAGEVPGWVQTWVAADAMRCAGIAASPEGRTCGASSSSGDHGGPGAGTETPSSSTKACSTSCRDER